MVTEIPRLVIAGLSGDSGKTVVSLSLLSALRRKGLTVATFKKGPDYIDAAWLTALSGSPSQSPCRNLDTYLVSSSDVQRTFVTNGKRSDVALIEGNRGVFDGRDISGTNSTAELAKLLGAPVILVVDTTKTTRTVAAMVRGCIEFDPDVTFAGVVLNRVAGKRHDRILRDTIEKYCGIPVQGSIPKLGADDSLIPGRHLGLVTPAETEAIASIEDTLSAIAQQHLEIETILAAAYSAPNLDVPDWSDVSSECADASVRVGYFSDSVFTFYYPDNLEALQREGAELVPISSLEDTSLADIDALYIGGGFPETQAESLCRNEGLMREVRWAGENGLPIYAECGGLIYLSQSLKVADRIYPMAGLFPVCLVLHARPVGHGYVEATVDGDNPFFEAGQVIRGHEFHYTGPATDTAAMPTSLRLTSGVGVQQKRDGLVFENAFAGYLHLHADGVKSWASALVAAARKHRARSHARTEDTDTGQEIEHGAYRGVETEHQDERKTRELARVG